MSIRLHQGLEENCKQTAPPSRNSAMNMIVVFEDQATMQCQESKPYAFATALDVQCPCGNLMHPIPGAWCPLCGTKVVEVRPESRTECPAFTET
jgi:hypothetical protein